MSKLIALAVVVAAWILAVGLSTARPACVAPPSAEGQGVIVGGSGLRVR